MTARAMAAVLFVGCVWGTSFLFTRVAVQHGLAPMQVVLFRTLFGAIVLLTISLVQGRDLGLTARNLGVGLFAATVGALAPFGLIALAITRIESGTAAIFNATLPLIVVLLTMALGDEKPSPSRMAGIGIGLGGVVVLVGGNVGGLSGRSLVGDGLMLVAIVLYGVINVASRHAIRNWSHDAFSTMQIAIAALIAVPVVGIVDPPSLDYGWKVWGSLLALGVLGTGFAYLVYYWLIHHAGSVSASLQAYVVPVVGVCAGAILLNERIGWYTLVGGAIILCGVALVNLDLWRGGGVQPVPMGINEPLP